MEEVSINPKIEMKYVDKSFKKPKKMEETSRVTNMKGASRNLLKFGD